MSGLLSVFGKARQHKKTTENGSKKSARVVAHQGYEGQDTEQKVVYR